MYHHTENGDVPGIGTLVWSKLLKALNGSVPDDEPENGLLVGSVRLENGLFPGAEPPVYEQRYFK